MPVAPSSRRLADVALALALLAAAEAEVMAGSSSGWAALVAATAVAPLAWRRRVPLAPLLVLIGVALADVATGARWFEDHNVPVAVVLVAAFGLGAHTAWPASGVSVLVAVAGFAAAGAASGSGTELPWLILVIGMPWLAGRAVRAQRERTVRLGTLAARLAAEPDATAQLELVRARAQLAAETHDAVAHAVATMVLQAAGARATLSADPVRARASPASFTTPPRTPSA